MTRPADGGAISATAVRHAVNVVLDGEGVDDAALSVTFLSSAAMRALNRRASGDDHATDVIAYELPHEDRVVGDIYVCPPVARRAASDAGIPERTELIRLVVHGTLHVLGYDHPEGPERTESAMWETQEHYVRTVLEGRKQ